MHAGGTLKIVGLEDMGPEVLLKRVSKETLLGDIQYRGAISDFTIVKKQISKADYDELLIRYNEEDVYGDGNNFELAVTKAAAEAFETQEAERVVAAAAAAEAEAAGRRKPPSLGAAQKVTKPRFKPWVSQGSETEISEENVVTSLESQKLTTQVFRKRSSFGLPCEARLMDVDAPRRGNSASMECRPFKEKTPSVRFAEADVATQAVPATRSSATQATPLAPKPMSTQYEPRRSSSAGFESVGRRASPRRSRTGRTRRGPARLRAFLEKVDPLMRGALQQNECYDIFTDDFASLADDDLGAGAGAETAMTETHCSRAAGFVQQRQDGRVDDGAGRARARWRRRAWRRRRSRRPSPPEARGPGAPCSSGTSRTPSTLGAS